MNFQYLDILLKITIFWIIAVISPGPNFLLSLNTSIQYGKTKTLFTVLGIVSGTTIWAISGYLGISLLFVIVPWLYSSIKIIGAIYLICIGVTKILKKNVNGISSSHPDKISNFNLFKKGLFVNLSNPKTAIFITSLFATTIPKNLNWTLSILSILIILIISFIWYSFVCIIFSSNKISLLLKQKKSLIDKISGFLFILLGIKVLFLGRASN